jgi:catechol 2,3-dioxygenase-like lactoylglutathione lyase family enzyme
MKRTWTIIGVKDVPRSFRWYQSLFGQAARPPEHPHFGQLLDSDGTVLLCLHQWGVEDHPSLTSPGEGTPGNGLLLFFRVDDFDVALQRARALCVRLEEDPHVNPNTRTKEFSLRDPDGYYVTISALSTHQVMGVAGRRPNKGLQPTKARSGTKKSRAGRRGRRHGPSHHCRIGEARRTVCCRCGP